MKLTLILIVAVAIVSLFFIFFFIMSIPTQDYALDVDALKDEQSLFVNARVVISNTGKLPLTEIKVDYGIAQETLSLLKPGEKAHLSPPEGSSLDKVTVSSAEGVLVTKEYRTPIKLPGMIGS